MRKQLLAILGAAAISVPAMAALEIGDSAPDFDARASLNGESFDYSLGDALAKGNVVVYFYPSAYTRGCNIQAREFAENMDKFNAVGATVIGVSLDGIERLNEFSADPEYCAGKLAVASDANGEIASAFNLEVRDAREGMRDSRGAAIDHGMVARTTFIVGQNGKIVATIGGVSPIENVQKSLEAVQQLQ